MARLTPLAAELLTLCVGEFAPIVAAIAVLPRDVVTMTGGVPCEVVAAAKVELTDTAAGSGE
jgi:hypothetical protein